ncbi:hypothetical protein BDZ45DRAFT_267935 [Acephala macrosclerotiorum]|nr:hypothetical protein BDZ45DRAFT_267935 [Acephala macrosclerotiorum]
MQMWNDFLEEALECSTTTMWRPSSRLDLVAIKGVVEYLQDFMPNRVSTASGFHLRGTSPLCVPYILPFDRPPTPLDISLAITSVVTSNYSMGLDGTFRIFGNTKIEGDNTGYRTMVGSVWTKYSIILVNDESKNPFPRCIRAHSICEYSYQSSNYRLDNVCHSAAREGGC